MEKFTTHTGIGVPLRQSNVDTDQIIPAVYLKRITRTGFEDALFSAWRKDPAFILNQEPFSSGSVLVAGPDFGTGSSREHAVWALKDYGFKTVLSSRFADIFRGNSGKQGLLAAEVAQDDIELIWKTLENAPGTAVTVDLVSKTVTCGNVVAPFSIDDYTRWRLLEGLDDIGLTLQHQPDITAYEATRPAFKAKTLPAGVSPMQPLGSRHLSNDHVVPTYKRPLDQPVLDWKELTPGETVVVVDRHGLLTTSSVDTLTDEGTMVWLKPQGLGHRTLYLRTDPVMIHRIS